jgi:hypothetical protein
VIEGKVFSVDTGDEICAVAFRLVGPRPKHGPLRGQVEVQAEDPVRAFQMQVFLERPHPMRTRRDDGSLEDHTIEPGTPGHFVLRLQALPAIGYRIEISRNDFIKRKKRS